MHVIARFRTDGKGKKRERKNEQEHASTEIDCEDNMMKCNVTVSSCFQSYRNLDLIINSELSKAVEEGVLSRSGRNDNLYRD